MKLHRFIGQYDLSKEAIEILDQNTIWQIKNVLRLEKGALIVLSDGKGKESEVRITDIKKDKIKGIIEKSTEVEKKKRKCTLYLAILKKENFELAAQKSVEAGICRIVPVITDRTIKTGLNIDRLEKIIREASEQSGRSIIPILSPIVNFEDAIKEGSEADEKIIFHLKNETYQRSKEAEKISIFIGPEGGFTDREIKMAERLNYKIFSLGSLTLRAETAAIIGSYRAVKGI